MELLDRPEFASGLASGVLFTSVAVLAALVSTARLGRRTLPLGGAAFVLAGLVALGRGEVPPLQLVALGGLAGVAGASRLIGTARAVAAASPFAAVLALGLDVGPWPARVVFVAVALVPVLVAAFEDAWPGAPVGPPLFAASVVGVALSVPDTEHAAALAGAAVPLAAVGWPLALLRLGRAGAGAAAALVVWAAALDTTARPATLLAAVACFALLCTFPLAARVRRSRAAAWTRPPGAPSARPGRAAPVPAPGVAPVLGVLGAHVALVLGAARLAGGFESVAATAIVASTCVVCSFAVSAVLVAGAGGRA